MKPWLLNILACPIDKHHPLEAYFFKWETGVDEMEKMNREAGNPSKYFKKQYQHLAKQIADGTISPPAMNEIRDESESRDALELYGDVKKFIERLGFEEKLVEERLVRAYPEGIDVLYRYLNLVEVEEGLLRCNKCGRWYPIGSAVETIPELMPDDLRERERDLKWLEKWREKVPESVLKSGKPFTL
jgi:uncharacterized protein YbaR (Trm112 family)